MAQQNIFSNLEHNGFAMSSCDLFVVAGEASGDLLGSELTKHLKHLQISGVGGPLMRPHMECLIPMESFQVMGFIDVIKSLPRMIPLFYRLRQLILKKNPKAILFIDYPGLSLKMATHLRKKGYKGQIIQYVCPSVWAWKKNRTQVLENHYDCLISLFPFEKKCFNTDLLDVKFMGHPLVEKTMNHKPKDLFQKKGTLLSIFPGSRKKEVLRNLPIQLAAAKKLKELYPNLQIALSVVNPDYLPNDIDSSIKIVSSNYNYDLMGMSDMAIATSGTVTLELGLFKVPTVVTYAITPLDEFLATRVFKINMPFYCIVNILSNKEVYPELFGSYLNVESLVKKVIDIINTERSLDDITNILTKQNAAKEASAYILSLIQKNSSQTN